MENKGALKGALLLAFLAMGIIAGTWFLGGSPKLPTLKSATSFVKTEGWLPLASEGSAASIKIIPGVTGAGTQALFDIVLKIPREASNIKQNQSLLVSVELTNFGSEGPTNVSLTYIITNSKGYVVFLEHEKRIVETQSSFLKILALPSLNRGDYQLFSELLYSNTSAIASEKFSII